MHMTTGRILALTARESALLALLKDAASTAPKRPVVCRITGGWVRDKLLGKPNDDLDVSLDTMMGYDFAQHLQSHMRSRPQDREQNHGEHSSHVARIRSNPDRSKHLETATCMLLGYSVDFVNLRAETYSETSRIPTEIQFGTPLQDALRRDCTINALFYNVQTNQVEDFTEKGLSDLDAKIIRTPMDPDQTFADDPLRILRAIRFAGRFNFKLDEDLKKAAAKPEIQHTLATKISRERIGIEIKKMLETHDESPPTQAVSLLNDLGLLASISIAPCDSFAGTAELGGKKDSRNSGGGRSGSRVKCPVENTTPDCVDFGIAPRLCAALDWITAQPASVFASSLSSVMNVEKIPASIYLSAMLLPIYNQVYSSHSEKKSNASKSNSKETSTETSTSTTTTAAAAAAAAAEVCEHIVKFHFKLPARVSETVRRTLNGVHEIDLMLNRQEPYVSRIPFENGDLRRLQLGTLVQRVADKICIKEDFGFVFLLAAANSVVRKLKYTTLPNGSLKVVTEIDNSNEIDYRLATQSVARYINLLSEIKFHDLAHAWEPSRLLNGHELKALLDLNGGALTVALELINEWQLAHKEGTKSECEAWVSASLSNYFASIKSQTLDLHERQGSKRRRRMN